MALQQVFGPRPRHCSTRKYHLHRQFDPTLIAEKEKLPARSAAVDGLRTSQQLINDPLSSSVLRPTAAIRA
jgi:hypothetical protein